MYKSLKRLQIYLPASNQIPALMHNKHVLENETLRQVQCQWLFVVEMLVWIKKCRQYKSPLHNDNHAKSVEPLDQQSAPPKVKASATPQNLLQHIASLFMMNSMICNIMFQWLAGLNPCHPKPWSQCLRNNKLNICFDFFYCLTGPPWVPDPVKALQWCWTLTWKPVP